MKDKKSLAVIGIGKWGKNLLREFGKIANLEWCFYKGSSKTKKWLKENYPHIKIASSYNDLLTNPTIDAIVIATPIKTHYELVKRALQAGKNVFVEKPMTENMKQAQELVALAQKKNRILFVGHIFSYHPILTKIKSIVRQEPLKYAAFVWNKFGTFNEELIFNLVSHDVAMALDFFGKPNGIKTLENHGLVTSSDVICIRFNFKKHRSCTIYVNRVSSHKNKTVTLATNKNVYFWENDKLFKLYRKTATLKLIYKSTKTPLEVECREFVRCITENKKPLTDGGFGLKVVKILSKI